MLSTLSRPPNHAELETSITRWLIGGSLRMTAMTFSNVLCPVAISALSSGMMAVRLRMPMRWMNSCAGFNS